jgi:S1-C subfamily serine protease
MKKCIIIIFCLIGNQLFCQLNEENVKDYFFSKITELEKIEGIYTINKVEISNSIPNCEKIDVYLNEKISIIRQGENYLVTSLKNGRQIGKINLKYNYGHIGTFVTNGYSEYPDCDIRELFWYAEFSNIRSIYPMLPENIKQAIYEINRKCICPNYLSNSYLCNTKLTYILDKIFPNRNEPPPNQISTGTGVIISKLGYILTNKHVVEKQQYVWNEYPGKWEIGEKINYNLKTPNRLYPNISTDIKAFINGQEYELTPVVLLDGHEVNLGVGKNSSDNYMPYTLSEDLIILKILNPPILQNAVVFDTNYLKLGTEIYSLGFPLSSSLGSRLIFSNGYYSNSNFDYDIFNLGLNPGNSGGGIFNKKSGNLVGIATARPNDENIGVKTEGLAFSTRLNFLARILKNPTTFLGDTHMKSSVDSYGNTVYFWKMDSISEFKNIGLKIKDTKYKPILSLDNNQKSTVSLIAY